MPSQAGTTTWPMKKTEKITKNGAGIEENRKSDQMKTFATRTGIAVTR
jgi:hypothetical protein